MPDIRPFRALRYNPEVAGDPALLVAPPYDVIGPTLHERLLARHPRNSVRLDLPAAEPGDEPDERYRRVARTIAEWRSDGTLRRDPRPSVYVYEQTYRVPGTSIERTQRGFFARLRIEPFGPGSSVLPHERTLSGPKEDRYRLLRATGLNTSPVVGLYDDPSRASATSLAHAAASVPVADLVDDDGVRHRLWVVAMEPGGVAESLIAVASAGPVFIADGHHRYETALRYRDERRVHSSETDPAFDFLLMLFLDAADALTVLPTHRLVRGLGDEGVERLVDGLPALFHVEPTDREALIGRFEAAGGLAGGGGRFGLLTRSRAWLLTARRDAIAALQGSAAGSAVGALDVSMLGMALEALAGIDPAAVAGGQRIAYTKSARDAAAAVAAGEDGVDAALLLEPTPVASILAVARDGDVMPQKSTYFYPKALTGLLLNPHEW